MNAGPRPDEVNQFLPAKPGLLAHCRRVATLAAEVAARVHLPPADQKVLVQAALLHHTLDASLPPISDRLIADVTGSELPAEQNGLSVPANTAAEKSSDRLPRPILAILASLHGPPESSGTTPALPARILEACNLFDEQIELLPLEPKSVAEILSELTELAAGGILDGTVVAALADLTTRSQAYLTPLAERLPAGARVARQALRTLVSQSDFELYELEAIAREDPILAASVIECANAAVHSRGTPARSLREAMGYLGTRASRRILLAAAIRPLMRSAGLEQIWRHSISTSVWCQQVAAASAIADPEEAMLAGLMHDIGRAAVASVGPRIASVYTRLLKGDCPPTYAETILLGKDHGEIGADILSSWYFPQSIVEAVRSHHQPERTRNRLAGLLYLSEFWDCSEEDLPSALRLRAAQQICGVTTQQLPEIESRAHPSDVLSLLLVA